MRKITLLLAVLSFVYAGMGQLRTISGTVTDDKGDVIPGTSIKIKGTQFGVAADKNGQFRISAKTGDVSNPVGHTLIIGCEKKYKIQRI